MRLSLILLSLLTLSSTVFAKKKSSNTNYCRQVYIYGLSTSFNDSTAYLTDVQRLDSAYLNQGKFLGGIKQYVEQLDAHFFKLGKERISTIFFATKQSKAEKQYLKLRKKYLNPKSKIDLKPLTIQEFTFTSVRPNFDEDQLVEQPKKSKDNKREKPAGFPDGKRPPMGGPGGMGKPM